MNRPARPEPSPAGAGAPPRRIALVVFSGRTRVAWLRCLRPGFRHCFAVIEDPPGSARRWIVYEPLCHRTEVSILDGMPLWWLVRVYAGLGHTVVPCTVAEPPLRPAPWGPYSCVEAVKRVLGIHAWWVITPLNLFNFLKNKKNRK